MKHIFQSIKSFFSVFNTTLDFVRILWSVSANLIYQLLILFVGFCSFVLPDQSWDLFQSFAESDISFYKVLFFVGVLCWGFSMWLCARIVLYLVNLSAILSYYRRDISQKNIVNSEENTWNIETFLTESLAWIPRFFGAAPFFIIALAYQVALNKYVNEGVRINNIFNKILIFSVLVWLLLLILSVLAKSGSRVEQAFLSIANIGNRWVRKVWKTAKPASVRNLVLLKFPMVVLSLLSLIFLPICKQLTDYYTILYLAFGFIALNLLPLYSLFFNKYDGENFNAKRFDLHNSLSFWKDVWPRKMYSYPLLFGSILTVLFGVATMLSTRFAEMVMPGTIIIFALCFWTFVGGFFNAISISWRFPIGALMLILLFSASYFNNNHEVQSQNTFTKDTRRTVDEHFEAWKKSGNGSKKKVILVAAEGGGIRAAYWSANVLATLEKRFEKDSFYNAIFAMSGASGGSVGVTMYRAEHAAVASPHDRQYAMDRICSSDFLSSLTSSFTFGDAIQRFIPFGFKNLCRARYLENTFDEHFTMNTNYSSQLSQGISLLRTDGPMLLLNTTHVETGQKAIISDDKLDTERYFIENQDVIHNIQADIPLKTAASTSARFPLVTPPALLVNQQTGQRLGHLIDGGNFDNTGLHSLWQLLRQLRDLEKNNPQKSEVLILYIRNGSNLTSTAPTIGPTYELAPIYGFVGAWASQTISKPLDMQLLAKDLDAQMLTIELDYTPKFAVLPLGWYLSEKAKMELSRQISHLDSEHNKAAVDAIGVFLKK